MKFFIIFFIFLLFFTGCSTKNAFGSFSMSKDEELGYSNMKSSKIISHNKDIGGVVSVIYLNGVYPNRFSQNEWFFVSYFIKEAKDIYDPNSKNDSSLKITLNSKEPLKVEKLQQDNEFSHLINSNNEWSRYYLVEFEKTEILNLLMQDGEEYSAAISYKKE